MRIFRDYALAFVFVAAGTLFSMGLGSWAELDITALFALAVLCASSIGGIGPGLFATLLAAAATALAQAGWTFAVDLGSDDVLRLAVFVVIAAVVSSLAARQRSAEEQLRRAVKELKERDAAKDSFLATLSHELRTPLTSILGWSRLLGERDVDAVTVATAAESIGQSARSQQLLIDDLLDMSRIIFDKLRLVIAPIDLGALVRATAALIRPAAAERQIDLRVLLPPRPCVVEGDEGRIKQVIWNFLTNAMKFTPPGGRVELRLDLDDAQAHIVVTDSGEGIDAESLPRVFDRFQGGAKGGLGLGLAIARHIVEAHHGSIAARSEGKNRGATFVASLALAEVREDFPTRSAARVTY